MNQTNQVIINQLIESRRLISNLLEKTWEFAGYSVGEEEFESYDFVKDSRAYLLEVDETLKKGVAND